MRCPASPLNHKEILEPCHQLEKGLFDIMLAGFATFQTHVFDPNSIKQNHAEQQSLSYFESSLLQASQYRRTLRRFHSKTSSKPNGFATPILVLSSFSYDEIKPNKESGKLEVRGRVLRQEEPRLMLRFLVVGPRRAMRAHCTLASHPPPFVEYTADPLSPQQCDKRGRKLV